MAASLLWSSDAATWNFYPTNISRIPFLPAAVNCVNGVWYVNDASTNAAYALANSRIFTRTNIPYPSFWTPLGATGGTYISINSGTNVYTSTNGSTWVLRNTGITNTMTCIGFGANCFIVGCADGTLLRSGSIAASLSVKIDSTTKLPLVNSFGGFFKNGILQVSTNLTSWTNLVTLTNNGGTNQFLDSAATNNIARYYRVVSQ